MTLRLKPSGGRWSPILAGMTFALLVARGEQSPPAPRDKASPAPYVASPEMIVEGMLRLADVDKDDVVCDLGSGAGRNVIMAAEIHGARGIGFELDGDPVRRSTESARRIGVARLVEFRQQDVLTADLSPATVVTIYLGQEASLKLRPALRTQLRPGGRRHLSRLRHGRLAAGGPATTAGRVRHGADSLRVADRRPPGWRDALTRSTLMRKRGARMRLEGKTAIVTGASRGLGRAIALAFAREGADVLINYTTRERQAGEVAAAIEGLGRRAILHRADVSDAAQARAMVEAALARFGRVDVLVNNAGITMPKGLLETSEAEWDRVLAINLKGVFLCCQAVAHAMMAQGGGRIINIASTAGQAGILSGPAYCASKAGVLGLTKCLARAFAAHHVQVNAISPAMIDTEILYWRTPEQWKETLESIPLKKLGNPDDLAEAAVFLASSGGNFVTGATIDVNGGLFMA